MFFKTKSYFFYESLFFKSAIYVISKTKNEKRG